MRTLPDLDNGEEIARMVRIFYTRIADDSVLGPFFTQHLSSTWEVHQGIMTGFWSSILLGSDSYRGRALSRHFPLLTSSCHVKRWLTLFESSLHLHYQGAKTGEAITRARHIAGLIAHRAGAHAAAGCDRFCGA